MITAGTQCNVIRTLMPLTIKNDELIKSGTLSNALRVPKVTRIKMIKINLNFMKEKLISGRFEDSSSGKKHLRISIYYDKEIATVPDSNFNDQYCSLLQNQFSD